MDLTLFIVVVMLIAMVYYLVASIQSLIVEIKEIKSKCIHTNNATKADFTVETPDPGQEFKDKALQVLKNVQYILYKN